MKNKAKILWLSILGMIVLGTRGIAAVAVVSAVVVAMAAVLRFVSKRGKAAGNASESKQLAIEEV